MKIRNLR